MTATDPQTPIASLKNVSKAFGPLHVLRDLSLDFQRGQTTVILGPSGTGKSVLLKHIVRLLRPDQGEIFFDGHDVNTAKRDTLVQLRTRIGFLFQMSALFDSLTVGHNVGFPLDQHTTLTASEKRERIDDALEAVGLPDVAHKMPADLSGGQKKRVALARAIVLQPDLILYDEPTTGLDPIRADLINELILALGKRPGVSSIVVTHDMTSARKIADRLVLLYDGKVVADGDVQHFEQAQDDRVQRFIHGRADAQDIQAIRSYRPHQFDDTPLHANANA
ncbi:MAG: ABC transporter ATP-binding protein [Planctomycetota bacterium]